MSGNPGCPPEIMNQITVAAQSRGLNKLDWSHVAWLLHNLGFECHCACGTQCELMQALEKLRHELRLYIRMIVNENGIDWHDTVAVAQVMQKLGVAVSPFDTETSQDIGGHDYQPALTELWQMEDVIIGTA